MAEQEQGRNEPATPFRREEARRKGNVAKSLEVNAVVVLLGVLGVVVFAGPSMVMNQLTLSARIYSAAATLKFDYATLHTWLSSLFVETLLIFLPIFVVVGVLAILLNILQTGAVLSADPLKPDFSRISPAVGLKRVFSVRIVYETIKNIIKIFLCVGVAYLALTLLIPKLLSLSMIDVDVYGKQALDFFVEVAFKLLMVLCLVAVIDFFYSRWDYARNLRMSRRELREEIKQREGDPRIKGRRRELQQEMLKKGGALNRVKDADVLITNPEHYAIALLYERGKMSSPQLIAKGSGQFAQNMMMVARKHHVPIFRNKKLARMMYFKTPVDSSVPPELFADVARIMAWAYDLVESRRPMATVREKNG